MRALFCNTRPAAVTFLELHKKTSSVVFNGYSHVYDPWYSRMSFPTILQSFVTSSHTSVFRLIILIVSRLHILLVSHFNLFNVRNMLSTYSSIFQVQSLKLRTCVKKTYAIFFERLKVAMFRSLSKMVITRITIHSSALHEEGVLNNCARKYLRIPERMGLIFCYHNCAVPSPTMNRLWPASIC